MLPKIMMGAQILAAIGAVVLIHELGHFLVAKWRGVKVHEFSLGFKPKLIGFKRGDTEYMISSIPLGGYVKLAGEELEDDKKYEKWEFYGQPWWARILVYFAGPFMNYALAVFLFALLLFVYGLKIPSYVPVADLVEKNSPAEKAGLKNGDEILEIKTAHLSRKINDFYEILSIMQDKAQDGENAVITVRRQNEIIQLETKIEKGKSFGIMPDEKKLPPVFGELEPGRPAEKAGFLPRDRVLEINGKTLASWGEMADIIHNSGGKELAVLIEREGAQKSISVTPLNDSALGFAVIGVRPQFDRYFSESYGVLSSIKGGFIQANGIITLSLSSIYQMIKGKISAKDNLGGPIAIGKMAYTQAKKGFESFVQFFAFVSVSLGLLNMFPVPVLDGGNALFFCLYEGIRGKPMRIKTQTALMYFGISLLGFLMVFVFYNDIYRLFH